MACVGSLVGIGVLVAGSGVTEATRVGEGTVVAVAGGAVATRTMTRGVGEGGGGGVTASEAHAVSARMEQKTKSEHARFALGKANRFMRAIVATHRKKAKGRAGAICDELG